MSRKPELTLAASRPSSPSAAITPVVFNPEMVRKLTASNRCIRWLRRQGVSAMAADLLSSKTTTVVVPPSAAEKLRREAYRLGLRCMTDAAGGTVFMDDCALTWRC